MEAGIPSFRPATARAIKAQLASIVPQWVASNHGIFFFFHRIKLKSRNAKVKPYRLFTDPPITL